MPFERRRRQVPHSPNDSPPSPPLSPLPITSNQSSSSLSTESSTSASDSSSLATPFESLRVHEGPPLKKEEKHQELDLNVNMFEHMHRGSRISTPDSPSYRTRPLLQQSHTQVYTRPSGERPSLPRRNTSFTKRHASFDSPREVPLPYMPSQVHNPPYSPSSPRVILQDTEHDPSPHTDNLVQPARPVPTDSAPNAAAAPSTAHSIAEPPVDAQVASTSSQYMDTSEDLPTPSRSSSTEKRSPERNQHHQYRRNISGPVQMYGRPMSSPETGSAPIYSPRPMHAAAPSPSTPSDSGSRSSTLSLPIPMHTPYHTLPSVQGSSANPIPEGQPAPRPPPTTTVPSSDSYPQATLSRGRRPGYMAQPPVPPRAAFASNPPDWLRENSEPRRNAPPASTEPNGYPMPAPPIVLTPPPPPLSNAAHEPFLSHAPPPQDSYIAVETSPSEYRLIVRLPGYRRDSITLSTRRRRILHVVADSWEPGGGHFERRISFGYDADLVQVRAEFDGELLRIIVPRRMALVTYWGTGS